MMFGALFAPFLGRITSYEALDYDSVADAKATVVRGNARFTVLTPQLIRFEQSATTTFEDRATLAIVNRKLPVPKFTASDANGELTIKTDKLTLTYTLGAQFSASTLSAKGDWGAWSFGARNDGNLLGTIKSLDQLGAISLNCTENSNVTVHGESLHCEWGVVSRDGWAVYDDTKNYGLGAEDWWESQNTNTHDGYLFAHGIDYKGALRDLVAVGGKVPLVPRGASGTWWTRWWDFADRDVQKVVDGFRQRSIPLDVLVLDMNWVRRARAPPAPCLRGRV